MEQRFLISTASDADLDEICTLVNSAYRGDSSRAGWTTEADFLDGQRTDRDSLAAWIEAHETRRILCLRDYVSREVVACVCLDKFSDLRGTGCVVGMLTVKPGVQNSGVGKLLLNAAEEDARFWGATRTVLQVIHVRDSLIAWYLRRGYKATGETKPFPYGQEKFGLPKRDDLYFQVFEKTLRL